MATIQNKSHNMHNRSCTVCFKTAEEIRTLEDSCITKVHIPLLPDEGSRSWKATCPICHRTIVAISYKEATTNPRLLPDSMTIGHGCAA